MPTDPPPSAPVRAPDRHGVNRRVVDTISRGQPIERDARHRVSVDVEVETVDGYADIVRTTGRYVSYADIVECIQARAACDEHITLVETWAEDVATFALTNELAAAVRVTVQKIDIFDDADGVGISIERRSSTTTNSGTP